MAATFSGAPSTLHALLTKGGFRSAIDYVYDATSAVGTLVPPGRPGFKRGAIVHAGISAACGEALARTLPQRHSVAWGSAAGLAIGVLADLGVVAGHDDDELGRTEGLDGQAAVREVAEGGGAEDDELSRGHRQGESASRPARRNSRAVARWSAAASSTE